MSAQELQNLISPKFNKKILEEIVIKKSGFSDVNIKEIRIGESSKKGDSYMSNICRFTITASGKIGGETTTVSIPVIVKSLPQNIGRKKTFRSADFFENEIIFYQKVWSAFEEFLQDEQATEKCNHIPLLLAAYTDGENDFIALEDVSPKGYTNNARGTGLDLQHTTAILKTLADFHALSLAFKEKQPLKFEQVASQLKETYCSESLRSWYINYHKNICNEYRNAVKHELPEEYLKKIDELLSNDLYGEAIKSCTMKGPLAVVTHGDVWIPNFLIQYDGSKPANIIMVDFQFTRYAPLANDLLFFLLACVDTSLLESQWESIVNNYHSSLIEAQKKYKCKHLIDVHTFKKELLNSSKFGVCMSMEAVLMSQLEDDEICDLDAITAKEAAPIDTVFIIPRFKEGPRRRRLAELIKCAVDKKLI